MAHHPLTLTKIPLSPLPLRYITHYGGKPHGPSSMYWVKKPKNPSTVTIPHPPHSNLQWIMLLWGLTQLSFVHLTPLKPCSVLAAQSRGIPRTSFLIVPSSLRCGPYQKLSPLLTHTLSVTFSLTTNLFHDSFLSWSPLMRLLATCLQCNRSN